MGNKGFFKEIKRVTITDSQEGNKEEADALVNLTKQKIEAKESSKPEISQPVFDEAKFQEMMNSAISTATNAIASQKNKEIEAQKSLLEGQYKAEKTQLEKQIESIQQTLQESQQQLKQSQETITNFEGLFKLTGATNPIAEKAVNFNTNIASDRDKLSGTVKEIFDLYDRLPKVQKIVQKGEGTIIDCDKVQLDRYVRENRTQLQRDLTQWGQKNGWFQGTTVTRVVEAATTIADIPPGFLPTLSSLIRTTHRPQFIFWQFAQVEIDYQAGEGTTIQVPRIAYLVESTNPDDYKLSGGGTFVPIVSTNDPIQSGSVPIVLEEWGRGKAGATVPLSPVAIPSFVQFTSMLAVTNELDRKLGYSYASWEDRKIRSYWNVSSRVIYNNNGRVTTNPADLTAGKKGTMSRQFVRALRTEALLAQIEPLPDGNYILVLQARALEQYADDVDDKWTGADEASLRQLTNILNPTYIPPEDTSRISGYYGLWDGVHIFSSNGFSAGAVGTEGVQNETLGVGSTLTRTSFLVGSGTVGRGTGMPMELRQDEVTNFGRLTRMTWLSHEGFAALDVDPVGYNDTSIVPQQLRVLKIRTTDLEI